MRVLVTRARADAEETARLLSDRGVETELEPLLTINWLSPEPPVPEAPIAYAVTSRNGAEALGRRMQGHAIHCPVFAVGDRTAEILRAQDIPDVRSAEGDVNDLAAMICADMAGQAQNMDGPVVHIGGEETAGDLTGTLERMGLSACRVVAYRVETPKTLSSETVAAIRTGRIDGVIHFSPRSAETFVRLAAKAALGAALAGLDAFCMSEAVRKKAESGGWRQCFVATRPTLEAMIDLVVSGGREQA